MRYSNNEIYFDIEESMDAIVDRCVSRGCHGGGWEQGLTNVGCSKGKVLSSQVWGRIKCNARLTGLSESVSSTGPVG